VGIENILGSIANRRKIWHQVGAVAQLVARATPVRKVIWSRRVSLIYFFYCFFGYIAINNVDMPTV
jgi:hypothetical protein